MEIIYLIGLILYFIYFSYSSLIYSFLVLNLFLIKLLENKIKLLLNNKLEIYKQNKYCMLFLNFSYYLLNTYLFIFTIIYYLCNNIYPIKLITNYGYNKLCILNNRWKKYRKEKLINIFFSILNLYKSEFKENEIKKSKIKDEDVNKNDTINLDSDESINSFLLKIDNKFN